MRGFLNSLQLEASLFTVRVEDEIIVDDDPGAAPDDERTFYRNADRTRRDGVELGGRWWPDALPRLQLSGALTWMDARFDGESNNCPARPAGVDRLPVDGRYAVPAGLFSPACHAQYIGKRYADDANTVEAPSQTVTDLRLGRTIEQ
jgi:iron complex outermembrane receptor protein